MHYKKLQKVMVKKNITFSFFYQFDMDKNSDFFYFTNLDATGFLVVAQKGKPTLIVPDMEYEKAKKNSGHCKLVCWKGGSFFDLVKKVVCGSEKKKIGKKVVIGVNKERVRVAGYARLKKLGGKFVDISKEATMLRLVKSDEEIKKIKKACKFTDEIVGLVLGRLRRKKYLTEADVAADLEYETKKRGCGIAFPTIVASGKNAAQPHHETSPVRLKKGFLVIDFGITYEGYCSDMTRTVYLGKPTVADKKYYSLVLAANTRSMKNVGVGVTGAQLHETALEELGSAGKYFIHSLGHGVGIDVHEAPSIGPRGKKGLEAGMIITIEPGVYIPRKKVGIRIEDDVLVTKKGYEVLTKTPKAFLTMPLP